ncbi:MAG: hypothetical protein EOO90_06415 [Pedobacter sp.]|nr:MAG: hypothetical protein EOO90_06415 [Pedobacter sp.]
MSTLSKKTEKAVLSLLAKCLKPIADLNSMRMSAEDAFDSKRAENLIRGIIESNGYQILQREGGGASIRRVEKQ